ncbi:MAG: hypothetical protein ABIS07_05910 [Dokdonella sp.]
MRTAAADLDARRPVWLALSDLYLDTEYRSFVRTAARDLARSMYTLGELRAILFDEVHPILARNLCVTTGVWERFDQVWLAERILAQHRRPRWLRARGHCLHRYAILLWRLLEPRIERARAIAAAAQRLDDTIPTHRASCP